jgi:hypothetical protein
MQSAYFFYFKISPYNFFFENFGNKCEISSSKICFEVHRHSYISFSMSKFSAPVENINF